MKQKYTKYRQKLGLQLKKLRIYYNLSQRDLAEKIGRTQREVSDWERGKKLVPSTVMLDIVEIFSLSLDVFNPASIREETYA